QSRKFRSARYRRKRSRLILAPFLRCRFPRVTNKTCSRVRHWVFSRARYHSSGRSRLLAGQVAFPRAKLLATAWLLNTKHVNSRTRGVMTLIFSEPTFNVEYE